MSFNFGKRTNFVEVGLGGSLWTGESDESVFEESAYSYNLSPVIGWRKHFKNNLTLRIYANPLIHISGDYFYEESAIVPYFGGSFGYQF